MFSFLKKYFFKNEQKSDIKNDSNNGKKFLLMYNPDKKHYSIVELLTDVSTNPWMVVTQPGNCSISINVLYRNAWQVRDILYFNDWMDVISYMNNHESRKFVAIYHYYN